jgi:hypothetical protein
MYWNCLTHVASESNPDGSGKWQMTDARRLMHSAPIHAQSSKSRNPCYDEWYKLANRVSSGNMTLNTDGRITKPIHPSLLMGPEFARSVI